MSQRFRWSAERTLALEDLRKNGRASTRHLAKRWGWTAAKVQRFLAFVDSHADALNRYSESVKPVSVKANPIHRVSVKAVPLDRTTLDKLPLESGGGYTSDLINAMNSGCFERFGDDFKRVQHDNRSSVRTGQNLQAAGVELGFALMMLRRHIMRFHPEKHGKGKLPISLAFWEQGLLKAWRLDGQTEIPLLASVKGDLPNPLAGVHGYRPPGKEKPRKPEQVKQALWAVLEGLQA
jgi:hypothetical protein